MSCITISITKNMFIEFYYNEATETHSAKLLFKFSDTNPNWLFLNFSEITIKKLKRAMELISL